MGLAFKIAWRNLWRHKGKSLVIGAILFIGALFMTVGNGMISGMEQGLSNNIINLFTGDAVVISNEQEKDDVLFEFGGKPIKVIKNFNNAKKVLDQTPLIDHYLPAAAGMVFVFNSGSDLGNIMLLGVDMDKYKKMFPGSIKVTEGRLFRSGEQGVLVSEEARKAGFDEMNFWVVPKGQSLNLKTLTPEAKESLKTLEIRNELVFMGASESNSTMDIRVPVTGIMKFKALNKIWGNYCIVDIDSFREAHNYITGNDTQVKVSKEEQKLLNSDNLDQMFGSDNMIQQVAGDASFTDNLHQQMEKKVQRTTTDTGSYNIAFVKFKQGIDPKKAIKEINQQFKKENLKVRMVSWKDAVGTIGSMAVMIKGALNMFIMFIFFVAIIVIMNTLSMAALERVSEIGMMRAIGARKAFLRRMFISETGLLSFFFGGLGILVGIIAIYIINAVNITTTNEILQLVYGGDKLSPIFEFGDLLFGLIELLIVTFIAVIYPLRVVGKIQPLDAISRD